MKASLPADMFFFFLFPLPVQIPGHLWPRPEPGFLLGEPPLTPPTVPLQGYTSVSLSLPHFASDPQVLVSTFPIPVDGLSGPLALEFLTEGSPEALFLKPGPCCFWRCFSSAIFPPWP